MRLFVAINLPGSLRESLARWAREAGDCLPGARWIRPGNLHLTLRFLGEVEGPSSHTVAGELSAVAGSHRPMRLSISDPGALPSRGRARVAYVGLASDPRLTSLQAAISGALERRFGLAPEKRPYHAHITLARNRRGWTRAESGRWCEHGCPLHGEAFEVTYVDLMESLLSPSGARYHVVESFSLEK